MKGLYKKYNVTYAANGIPVFGKHFVLRPNNDPAAREALKTYAEKTPNEQLREDIFEWLHEIENNKCSDCGAYSPDGVCWYCENDPKNNTEIHTHGYCACGGILFIKLSNEEFEQGYILPRKAFRCTNENCPEKATIHEEKEL